jgi:hypothetical protein
MRIFDVNKSIRVVCNSTSSRSGFNHTATLFVNGSERETVKVHYINRTWESYEYESVLEKLADETTSLNDAGKKALKKFIKNGGEAERKETQSQMKTVAMVAKMGEIFGSTPKEKNDWKARMIKAGLGNKGLEMPEDWDSLSEEEKERRLNNVIGELSK